MAGEDIPQESQEELSTPSSERLRKTLTGHTARVYCVTYSSDGKYVASGDKDGIVKIWNADIGFEGNSLIHSLEGHTGEINAVSYSPDGMQILSCSDDATLRIWDTSNGQIIGDPLMGHTSIIFSAAYSPDGKHIVSCSNDKTIRIWDVETRETILGPLSGHIDSVLCVSYSPDGQHIASSSQNDPIQIWNAKTGEPLVESISHPKEVYTSVYSPDGRLFAAGCMDGNIYILDLKTRRYGIEPLKGHSAYVKYVSFSPNGKYLVSCSEDCTIRIWDLETRNQAIPHLLPHDNHSIYGVVYSPDGQHIVSGSLDKTVQIWDAHVSELDSQFLAQDASQVPNSNVSSIYESSNTRDSSLLNVEVQGNINEFFNLPASIELLPMMVRPSDEGQSKENKTISKSQNLILSVDPENFVAGEEAFPIVKNSKSQRHQDNKLDHGCIRMAEFAAPARHHYPEFTALDAADSISESNSHKSHQWNCVLCGLKLF